MVSLDGARSLILISHKQANEQPGGRNTTNSRARVSHILETTLEGTRFPMTSRIRSAVRAEELAKIKSSTRQSREHTAQVEQSRLNCSTQYAQTKKEDSLLTERRTAKLTTKIRENAMTCSVERTNIKLPPRGQLALVQVRPKSKKKTKRRLNSSCCTSTIAAKIKLPHWPHSSEPSTCYPVRFMLITSLILLLIATLATCYAFTLNTTHELGPRRQEAHEEDGRSSARPNLDATDYSRRPPGVNQAANDSHATGTNSLASLSRPRRALRSQHAAAGGTRQKPSSGSAVAGQTPARGAAAEQTSVLDSQQQQRASRGVKDVTAQNGQSVLLHCLIEPNENGELPEVSWSRGTGEPQLLTYETTTVIKDERFLVRQGISRPNDWALQIKSLDRTTDVGLYQCQTSGDSPQLHSYQLNIVEPQVSILDSPDLAVRLGAPINLTCVISQSADQLQYVFWYRDSRMINYDLTNEGRGKIVASKVANKQDTISSNLQIFQSRATDSGNYTCAPSGARSTSIYVHVLEATDKRLIMFQNDETNALAASSQQTNSAISVHVVRLSRGRAYAIFAAFLIFSSWFQLVAQIQTAISLVLLATIGVFLSHSTSRPRRTHSRLDKEDEHKRAEETRASNGTNGLGHDESCDPLLLERAREALNLLKTLGDLERSSQCSSVELNDEHGGLRSLSIGQLDERHKRTSSKQDRKLRGQLQTTSLSRPTSKHRDCHRPGRVPVVTGRHQTAGINQERPNSSSPQASPRGSAAYSPASSTSAGSTGYNSDSRHSCLANSTGFCGHQTPSVRRAATPNVSLINERDEDDNLVHEHQPQPEDQLEGRELEMVELLRGRPSALKLIIEQLEQSGGNRSRQVQPEDEHGDHNPCAGQTSQSRLLQAHDDEKDQDRATNKGENNINNNNNNNSMGANQNNKLQDDSSEQIYSVPSSRAGPTSGQTAQHQHHAVERGTSSATFERPD